MLVSEEDSPTIDNKQTDRQFIIRYGYHTRFSLDHNLIQNEV